MSDQTPEYTPGMFSAPPPPDHDPGQEPPENNASGRMVRRKAAVLLTVGALLIGGAAGAGIAGGIGASALTQAQEQYDSLREKRNSLQDDNHELRLDLTDAQTKVGTLEAEVEELEKAPALLAEQRKTEEAAAKKKADEEAKKKAAEKKAADEEAARKKAEAEEAARTFPGDGTFVVGEDIQPGRYKADAAYSSFMANCYWARLSGTSGDFEHIIANHNSQGPTTVTIKASDVAFETNGCTDWVRQD